MGADFDGSVASIARAPGRAPRSRCSSPTAPRRRSPGSSTSSSERYLTFDDASLGRGHRRRARSRSGCATRRRPTARRDGRGAGGSRTIRWPSCFLGEQPIGADDAARAALRAATVARKVVSRCCAGPRCATPAIQPLLDAVCAYLPSPLDVPPVAAQAPEPGRRPCAPADRRRRRSRRWSSRSRPAPSADLFYVRVYSGTLDAGRPARGTRGPASASGCGASCACTPIAASRWSAIEAGDIVAVAGLHQSATGDTLCDEAQPVLLEPIRFPDTVVSVAVEPQDRRRPRPARRGPGRACSARTPRSTSAVDADTGQTLLSGMGELHLDVIARPHEREFGVRRRLRQAARVLPGDRAQPQATGRAEYRRQVAGEQLFARVSVRVEPLEPTPGRAGRSGRRAGAGRACRRGSLAALLDVAPQRRRGRRPLRLSRHRGARHARRGAPTTTSGSPRSP